MVITTVLTDLVKNKKIFLDTNIFIYLLDEYPDYYQKVYQLFKSIEEGQNRAVTSVISPLEVLSARYLASDAQRTDYYSSFFVNTKNLSVMDIDYYTCYKAAEIRRIHGYRIPDSIQLASSIIHKCDLLITNDYKFKAQHEMNIVNVGDLP